jgi:hypothetical protein
MRRASLDSKKGVSLILKYDYLYSRSPSTLIQLAVFTPLSIRRGDGGEALVEMEVRLLLHFK